MYYKEKDNVITQAYVSGGDLLIVQQTGFNPRKHEIVKVKSDDVIHFANCILELADELRRAG